MARIRFVYIASVYCVSCLAIDFCRADQAKDEVAIRKSDDAYVEAYNNRDAKALAALWSPEAVYVDPETGNEAVGREEIEKEFEATFAELKGAKLEVVVESIDFLSPNVAVEIGTARVIRSDANPDESTYKALFVRREGQWLLDRVSEEGGPQSAEPQPSSYEHLKELEWMIGTWIDQDEEATVQTDCQWTKNRNFINRSFAVVVNNEIDMAGMQIIGWDPVAKHICSWIFDSDGGFSEGKWTRNGDDRWLIHQTGTLPDGSTTSAVNVIKRMDNNSFTWQSVNREVNGDILPNVNEVLVVRKTAE